MPNPGHIALHDGLFETELDVEGTGTARRLWLWARTCHNPACDCRDAVVYNGASGNMAWEELLRRVAPIHAAWVGEQDVWAPFAQLRGDIVAHVIDLDSGSLMRLTADGEPGGPERHDLVDGDLLEALGRLWLKTKNLPDPELSPQPVEALVDWRPGASVAWEEAYLGVRNDVYCVDDRFFMATEQYCVSPTCPCRDVTVDFVELRRTKAHKVGRVTVAPGKPEKLDPAKIPHDRFARLWAAFRKRHRSLSERFSRRYVRMKEYGALIFAQPVRESRPKVGRNEPCPCGSGKKHKKCCGAPRTSGGPRAA